MIKFEKLGPKAFAWLAATAALGAAAPATAAQITFSNSEFITIPSIGKASPYPSIIEVSGVSGPVTNVTATIDGFNHSWVPDVGVLLIGPTGLTTVLFNSVGFSQTLASNVTLIFDDNAPGPVDVPLSNLLESGTYQPTDYAPLRVFPDVTGGPYGAALSIFNGVDPNGMWSLYVYDFLAGDAGSIDRGWSLTFTTADVSVPEPGTLALLGLGLVGIGLRRRMAKAS